MKTVSIFAMAMLALPMLAGCNTLMAERGDGPCDSALVAVERAAASARGELRDGMAIERRQAGLDRLVRAANQAQASCGYDKPETRGSDRARQPKAG